MRTAAQLVLLVAITAAVAVAAAGPDKPSLQQLRAVADAAQGQHCAEACLEAAQALVDDSDKEFTAGNVDQAHQEMKDAVEYARRATQGSIESNKRQKKTEIGLRKLSRRMTDIRQTLAVDDRPAVDEAIKAVEKCRTDLLLSMFDEKK